MPTKGTTEEAKRFKKPHQTVGANGGGVGDNTADVLLSKSTGNPNQPNDADKGATKERVSSLQERDLQTKGHTERADDGETEDVQGLKKKLDK